MFLKSMIAGIAAMLVAGAAPAQDSAPAAPAPRPPLIVPLEPENTWHLDLTTGGRVTIQLRPDFAPGHVERIKVLTRQGFYDGLTFHRVIEGFMAQGGDPAGTGQGGSDLPDLNAEFNGLPHVRGALGMARGQEPNSANSQFYIMFVPRLAMDGEYTIVGRVVAGMNFVDAIERGEPPLAPSRIVRASIGADNVPPLSAEALRAAAPPAPAVVAAPPSLTAAEAVATETAETPMEAETETEAAPPQ